MKILLIFITALILASCKKEYIEHPTCRRYLELSDKFFPDSNTYTHTDTLWPQGRIANYACDSELLKLQTYVLHKEGCLTGGYQMFRYVIT